MKHPYNVAKLVNFQKIVTTTILTIFATMLGSAGVYFQPSSHFDLGTFARSIHSDSPLQSAWARATLDDHLADSQRLAALEKDAQRARAAARRMKRMKQVKREIIDLTDSAASSLHRAGAILAAVKNIPLIDLTDDDDNEDDKKCPICQNELPSSRSAERSTLVCEHVFCTTCIARWVVVNPSCPLCREPIK